MSARRSLSARGAFTASAGVLVVSLWASGAPTMVYPVYADQWDADELSTTILFAVYPVALVLALVSCGSISDTFGRRRVLLTGVAVVAAGTGLFVLTDDFTVVVAGRVLQGVGVGVSMSAASAALIEFTPSRDPAVASAVNTASTATGTAIAMLLGGALVEYTPLPTRLPFAALLTAALALLPLLWLLPEPSIPRGGRGRPGPLRLPSTRRSSFAVGIVSITVAFMMGAVFVALGAQVVRDLVGTDDAFLAAVALASWAAAIVPASLLARRMTPHAATVAGGGLAIIGTFVLLLAAWSDSLSVFLLASVLSGAGYGLLFYGGLGLVSASAAVDARAATLSVMYLIAYLAQGLTAVGIGWLASATTLDLAIAIGMSTIAALSLVTSVLAALERRHALT